MIVGTPSDGALRRQPTIPRPQEFNRGNIKITDSDGPLVLPPLPQVHTFVVTSCLGLPYEDSHDHIAKSRSVRKTCVGRLGLDIDVIRLRVFSLSVTGEATV